MAKRKRRRHQPDNDALDPRSPLLQPLLCQHAHRVLTQSQRLGAVEAVVMVMIPTPDGGADVVSCYAWPIEQGAPSDLMLDAMSHEIDRTRKEITDG